MVWCKWCPRFQYCSGRHPGQIGWFFASIKSCNTTFTRICFDSTSSQCFWMFQKLWIAIWSNEKSSIDLTRKISKALQQPRSGSKCFRSFVVLLVWEVLVAVHLNASYLIKLRWIYRIYYDQKLFSEYMKLLRKFWNIIFVLDVWFCNTHYVLISHYLWDLVSFSACSVFFSVNGPLLWVSWKLQ